MFITKYIRFLLLQHQYNIFSGGELNIHMQQHLKFAEDDVKIIAY